MAASVIQPKRTATRGWQRATWWRPPPQLAALGGYPVEAWQHDSGLFALSAVEVAATEPGAEPLGPEYHLSLSMMGDRCTSQQAKWALRCFGLDDAVEDNHVPHGRVRNFWRPVADRFSGYECPCVGDEPAVVEDRGDYIWRGGGHG